MNKRWWRKQGGIGIEKIVKAFAIVFVIAILIALFFAGKFFATQKLIEGEISPITIYAPYDFSYALGFDEEKTKELQNEALKNVYLVFSAAGSFNSTISDFRDKLSSVTSAFELVNKDPQLFNQKLSDFAAGLDKEELDFLINLKSEELKTFLEKTETLLNGLSNFLVVSEEDYNYLQQAKPEKVTFYKPDSKSEVVYNAQILFSLKQAKEKLFALAQEEFKENKKQALVAQKLLSGLIRPSIERDAARTEEKTNLAFRSVGPQIKFAKVKKDELIIAKGEKLTPGSIKKLSVLFKREERSRFYSFLIGNILVLLIAMLIGLFFIKRELPQLYQKNAYFYLILAHLLLAGLIIKGVMFFPVSYYIVPISAVCMLAVLLLDINAAVFIAVMSQLLAGVFFAFDVRIMTMTLVSCFCATYFAKGSSKRIHLLKTGFLVGLSNFSIIVALGLIDNLSSPDILKNGVIGITGGLLSWIIASTLLPLFESVFDVATDIKLIELSDLNHPLLKRMSLEAPGTYHHSIIVGNLAEAACESIGANALRARVGAYFHDIGKLKNPEYFSENQSSQEDEQKHEKLSPTMSSLIIINHVKEGLDLAKKYKLPHVLVEILNQHHGTGLIYYFYQRALEKIEDDTLLKEERFRYPGPKPDSKEAAVVLLADSVEAACRAIQNPNATKIQETVRRVINNKFIDRQLDLCELTLADLDRIAQVYTRVLTGLYHNRVEYPQLKKDAD